MANLAIDSSSPYEQLIAQMIRFERAPQDRLKTQKTQTTQYKATLSDLSSALSGLRTALKTLTDPLASGYDARTARVPSGAPFRATATDRAAPGSHTLEVRRLASADARLSERLAASGTGLSDWLAAQEEPQTFTLHLAAPTADDPAARVAVEVAVPPPGATDGETLDGLRTAIAGALDAAVADGRLSKAQRPQVALVRETTGSARLSITSAQTGFAGRLDFDDSAAGLLDRLQLTRDAVVAEGEAGGGMRAAVGTGPADTTLNSQFVLNGLLISRDRNDATDALDGVTLTMTATGGPTTFTVEHDPSVAEGQIKRFVERYNAALDFLRRRTGAGTDGATRGVLADDGALRGLRSDLRTDVATSAQALPGGLAALGLSASREGTLTLDKPEKLRETLAANPEAVRAALTGPEGVATKMEARLGEYVDTKGVLSARRDAADQRIRSLDTRIKRWDEQMARRETSLRQQFAKLQETMSLLQGQQNAFLSYFYY